MDKLKELVAAKRKAAEEEFKGKKYVKRSEIEELRIAKLREEERLEREKKVHACDKPAAPLRGLLSCRTLPLHRPTIALHLRHGSLS
jgi:hypothetical protein